MNRLAAIGSIVIVVMAAGVAYAAESLRILSMVKDDNVVVSFELADAYGADVHDAIASGLKTTFTYDVELKMEVPVWVDRTVAATVVTISDQYDNLTRQHTLSRSVDGHVESVVTQDETVVRRWLTTLDRLTLCRTSRLDPSRDYYVRISAQARPRAGSIIGWAAAVTGMAKFTFVP